MPKEGKAPALITWKYVEKNLPWGLIFLLGGGVALSKGGKVTGMSALLGGYLSNLAGLPAILILLLLCMFAQFATEFAVNVAIAQRNFATHVSPTHVKVRFYSHHFDYHFSYVTSNMCDGSCYQNSSIVFYVTCWYVLLHGIPHTCWYVET